MTRNRNTMHGTLRMVDAPSEQRLVMVAPLLCGVMDSRRGGGCIRRRCQLRSVCRLAVPDDPAAQLLCSAFSHTELW